MKCETCKFFGIKAGMPYCKFYKLKFYNYQQMAYFAEQRCDDYKRKVKK